MNIYLMGSDGWKLFRDVSADELIKRNITIGEGANIGEGASIGKGARIKTNFDFILISPLGSRNSVLTAYRHKGDIQIGTGCYLGSINEFEAQVKQVHKENEHARQYLTALEYIRKRLEVKR